MVFEPEFANVLKVMARENNTLSAAIRSAWDSGNLRTLVKNSPAKATGAHISIIGHITKTDLLRYLDNTESCNGFANRFLWLCVKRSKCLPEGGQLQDSDFRFVATKIKNAIELAKSPCRIFRSDPAKEIWAEVYPQLSEGLPGLLGAVTGRAEAYVTRIASVYALLDCSEVIEPDHLLAALAVWDYCFESCQYIFGNALGNPIADVIMTALKDKPEGMTRTAIYEYFGKNQSGERLKEAIDTLAGMGRVRITKGKAEGNGKRPPEIIIPL
jgi:hypothetical protein